MRATTSVCLTAWGWVGMATSPVGLLGTTLPTASRDEALSALRRHCPDAAETADAVTTRQGDPTPHHAQLHQKLSSYFVGQRIDWNETLDAQGATDFQLRVWNIVRSIPYGQVRSYSWVAAQAGSPGAARAVGQAMANNPFPIIVPCHRVVGQAGALTGFGGGLEMKRRLLAMEGASVAGVSV